MLQKIIILDIDAETGKRIALGIEKSYGEKKVHFIHTDVSNHKQVTGKYEKQDSSKSHIDVYSRSVITQLPRVSLTEYLIFVCTFFRGFRRSIIAIRKHWHRDQQRWSFRRAKMGERNRGEYCEYYYRRQYNLLIY